MNKTIVKTTEKKKTRMWAWDVHTIDIKLKDPVLDSI